MWTYQFRQHGGNDAMGMLREADHLAVHLHPVVLHARKVVVLGVQDDGREAYDSAAHDAVRSQPNVSQLPVAKHASQNEAGQAPPRVERREVLDDDRLLVGAGDCVQDFGADVAGLVVVLF